MATPVLSADLPNGCEGDGADLADEDGLRYGLPSTSWTSDTTQQFLGVDSSSPSTIWRLDHFVQDPGYLAYQEELRCLIFNTAQTTASTREGTPAAVAEAETVAGNNTSSHTATILLQGRRVEYLKNYVAQIAPWLDMFDSSRAFGIQVPVLAQTSPALLYAILALSARQIERKEGKTDSFDSLELYQEAIRLLTPLLQARDAKVIPICTILCVMEMMSASAQDWRKHLEGCAALFDAFGIHGFCGGLSQAVFWCYARMDLCGALISDGTQSTLVPLTKWLAPGADASEARALFRATDSTDMYANYAVYLCSRACDLIAARTRFLELGEANGCNSAVFTEQWLRIWDDLQAWVEGRPANMLPAQTTDAVPFPHMLFVHWAAISSNQLYHTACILLLGMMPRPLSSELRPTGSVGSSTWHAKRVCGISLTNPHQGCLNNAIQPLWVAGRLLSHKSEHDLVVKLIRGIEATTGWGASWRIADLETAWGYKIRKSG
ncbi:putative c6 transcription protein [Diplogelasinospora grovesii]|uniref:C6 transcription protein n=1 Tax=Diplogelasinospora grovesii TaxID=303347 RepID=A0AAN6S375_9PEZI|nr:putative c6 transcription protein [Diplogelasinospora grovesii]